MKTVTDVVSNMENGIKHVIQVTKGNQFRQSRVFKLWYFEDLIRFPRYHNEVPIFWLACVCVSVVLSAPGSGQKASSNVTWSM